MTTTDPTVQAVAEALDKNFNPDRYPVMAAMFMDYAEAAVAAARPIIEAQALREAEACADPDVHAVARTLARTTELTGADADTIARAAMALADHDERKANRADQIEASS